MAVVASVSASSGCSSPAFCQGGFIRTVNGMQTCEGFCAPSKCDNPTSSVCVNNLCAVTCNSQLDCGEGQDCVPAASDGPNGAVGMGMMANVCKLNGRSPIGAKCPMGNECGSIAPTCPDGSSCDQTQCGGLTCAPDPIACGGDAKCSIGKCPTNLGCMTDMDCPPNGKCTAKGAVSTCDFPPCAVLGCDPSQCAPLVCLSAGTDDADAYCTLQDCQGDANCPGGYFCEAIRDPHPICGAPPSKIPGLCGAGCTTNANCTAYGAGASCKNMACQAACVTPKPGDGTTFTQGPFCTMRNECRLRKTCDPCKTDLDCSATPGQHCTMMPKDGTTFCTADCASDADCANGFGCSGNECVPRYGSCKGTGKFCEPCHDDTECGAGLYCAREESGLERVCVIPIGTMMCTSDNDCPTSPSGMHGKCMDATVNSSPGDGVYHTCYLPFIPATYRFTCWPGNATATCDKGADCYSKMCVGADPAMGMQGACK